MTPETAYTYQNITVQYSDAQKALVLADQANINRLNGDLRTLQDNFNGIENIVNDAKYHLDNECNGLQANAVSATLPPKITHPKQECIDYWNGVWTDARNRQDAITAQMNTKKAQIAVAVKQLNDDIATIQNDIKLQIQTQLANSAAGQAGATAANTPNQAALDNAAALAALQNQAAADKLKQEQNTKRFAFFVVAIVVVVIAVLYTKNN